MENLNSEKTIYIIDGSSFLYRAYYALRPMHTSSGLTVHAVFGFCRMLFKLFKKFDPRYCTIVWDSKGSTARHALFNAYKATRQAPPSDLFEQKVLIKKFADTIGLHQVEQAGVEADDLMYSLACDMRAAGYTVVLVTTDKDFGQVLDDQTYLYDSFKEQLIDKITIEQDYGFPVEKIPFYYALIGDASDNIPGARGMGLKRQQNWLSSLIHSRIYILI